MNSYFAIYIYRRVRSVSSGDSAIPIVEESYAVHRHPTKNKSVDEQLEQVLQNRNSNDPKLSYDWSNKRYFYCSTFRACYIILHCIFQRQRSGYQPTTATTNAPNTSISKEIPQRQQRRWSGEQRFGEPSECHSSLLSASTCSLYASSTSKTQSICQSASC